MLLSPIVIIFSILIRYIYIISQFGTSIVVLIIWYLYTHTPFIPSMLATAAYPHSSFPQKKSLSPFFSLPFLS